MSPYGSFYFVMCLQFIIFILSFIPVADSDKRQAIKYLMSPVPVRLDGIYGVITINRYDILYLF